MEFQHRLLNKLWSLFLLLCITRVCHGQLMCYVCENCSQVNAKTPLQECNEDFFNVGGTTDSSVQTTTHYPDSSESVTIEEEKSSVRPTATVTKETTTTTTTTTEMPTTTNEPTTETTEAYTMIPETTNENTTGFTTREITTEEVTTTTERQQPPTPPTVGPPMTTTRLPTPPNPGPLKPIDDVEVLNNRTQVDNEDVDDIDEVDGVEIIHPNTKAYKPSAEFRVRQLRAVSDITYHCFKVQATNVNGSMIINRGCSRVATMQSVCGLWKEKHPTEIMNKCEPCTRSQCNGSTALNVSLTTIFIALVAIIMHRM